MGISAEATLAVIAIIIAMPATALAIIGITQWLRQQRGPQRQDSAPNHNESPTDTDSYRHANHLEEGRTDELASDPTDDLQQSRTDNLEHDHTDDLAESHVGDREQSTPNNLEKDNSFQLERSTTL